MFLEGRQAVVEILDMVLDYLCDQDIYNCLFVNRQFHAQAYVFLFKNITLYTTPSSKTPGRISYRYQESLRERLMTSDVELSSRLLSHVDAITVIINDGYLGLQPAIDFFDYVMKNAKHVKRVRVSDEREIGKGEPHGVLHDILKAFCQSAAKPELSLSLDSGRLLCVHLLDSLSGGRERLVSLSIWGTGVHGFLASKLHGEYLGLRNLEKTRTKVKPAAVPDQIND